MTAERIALAAAVLIIAASLVLGVPQSPFYVGEYWLVVPIVVGALLIQKAATGFCPVRWINSRLMKNRRRQRSTQHQRMSRRR